MFHIFESLSKEEVEDFYKKTNPDVFIFYTRKNLPKSFDIVYGLKYMVLN